jgi:hypothetical protein
LYQKKCLEIIWFNPEEEDTIIQIKGNGPRSFTANWHRIKNATNPANNTKTNT